MEDLAKSLLERANKNIKRTTTGIVVTLVSIVLAMCFITLYHPTPSTDSVRMTNQALEENRVAEMKLITAKLDSVRLENQIANGRHIIEEVHFRAALDENTKALNNAKNEKTIDYRNYSNVQLQRAVSDLVRFYEAAERTNKNASANR